MNIFMPYKDINESVKSLDDKRLLKQIIEVMSLIRIYKRQQKGEVITRGYVNHPIYKYYKDKPAFMADYAILCLAEYSYRYDKIHSMTKEALEFAKSLDSLLYTEDSGPAYIAGSGKEQVIDTTYLLYKRYQDKLIMKWKSSNPRWTKRNPPKFWTNCMGKSVLRENREISL